VPPFTGVAVKVTEVPEQIVVLVLLVILTDVATEAFTVMVILLLFAVAEVTHPMEEVSVQVTASPLFKVADEKVALFVPTGEPFTNHWYTGEPPPLIGVAVNVVEVPAQIVVADAAIETAGVTGVVTDIVITLLFAVAPLTQGALLVSKQLTVFPLNKVEVVYVALFVPTGEPFTNH
jgi:hypothetical protein